MSRNRGFTSLDECVNPIYYKAWGSIDTVQKVIKSSFDVIGFEEYQKEVNSFDEKYENMKKTFKRFAIFNNLFNEHHS